MPAYSTILLTALAALVLSGCAGPAYYAQAAAGQFELLRQREPIEDLLARPDTDPQLAARLRTALAARRFAIEQLGLPDDGSYTRFVATGREAVTWTVIAAPEFSLEPRRWCFPVAGCVPYRGYFDPDAAVRFADRMRRRGYDVAVVPALAYSTLGWFEDPLPDTLLRYGDDELAATLFHEMAHARLYHPGDAAFNESFATFVEARGLERWLAERGEAERVADWQTRRQAGREFQALLADARAALADIYGSDTPEPAMREAKAAVFERLRSDYAALVRDRWDGRDRYGGWFDDGLNNARLALARTYAGGLCAFAGLFADAGADFARFYRMAEARAALDDDARRAWLQRPCAAIAPLGDL